MFKTSVTTRENLPFFSLLVLGSDSLEISHSSDILMSSRATVASDDKTVASKISYIYRKTNY